MKRCSRKRPAAVLAALACAWGLFTAPAAAQADVATYVDMLGRKVTLKRDIRRIALLRTMDIYLQAALLGERLEDRLVAVGEDFASTDNDGYRKLSERMDLSRLVNLGSVGKDDGINIETVASLGLDLIVVDAQFEKRASVRKMVEVGLPVFFTDLNPDPIHSTQRAMRILGKIEGVEGKAEEMAEYADRKTEEILRRVDEFRASAGRKPVIYIEQGSTAPSEIGYSDGDITSSWGLVWHRLGADNIGAGLGFQILNPERVLSADPDIIVIGGSNWSLTTNIMRLGFYATPEAASEHLGEYVEARAGWSGLKAVRDGRLYAIYYNFTGKPYGFARLEAGAKILYPEAFADLDPEKDIAEFFSRYMPAEFSGCFHAQWRP